MDTSSRAPASRLTVHEEVVLCRQVNHRKVVSSENTKTLHKASLISLCFVIIGIVQLMSVGCRLRTIIYCPQIVFTLSSSTHVISSYCIFISFELVRVKLIWQHIKALTCPYNFKFNFKTVYFGNFNALIRTLIFIHFKFKFDTLSFEGML